MTALDLHLTHLAHNLSVIRAKLKEDTRIIGVVKANAYGQGVVPIAKKLVDEGVTYLAVAYVSEGIELRAAGIRCRIMVFYPQPENFSALLHHCLEPALYSPSVWTQFFKIVQQNHIPDYPVHVKFNTGLNRIGFAPEDVNWLLEQQQNTSLEIVSIYSHLAASEEPKPHSPTRLQWKQFEKIKAPLAAAYPKAWFHLLNTSGVFNYPEWQMDAVRVGIGLYGYANHPEWDCQLKSVAALRATIIQIHPLEKGDYVGYNHAWQATKKGLVACLPIGHADGIGRQFGHGKGSVWIHGQQAPIVGNVCMDMLMVDVTHIDCQPGDPVIFFNADHNLIEWAQTANTIPYELLTGLSNRIPRQIHS